MNLFKKLPTRRLTFLKTNLVQKFPFILSISPHLAKAVKKGNIGMKWANPLSAKPTKWSNTLNQVVGSCQQIF